MHLKSGKWTLGVRAGEAVADQFCAEVTELMNNLASPVEEE